MSTGTGKYRGRKQRLGGIASALLLMLGLAGCSSKWQASAELRPAGANMLPLQIKLRSSLGEELASNLIGGCATVEMDQSPKLPNRITITILDRDGKVLGQSTTHDLASQPFSIALAGGGTILVTPGKHC